MSLYQPQRVPPGICERCGRRVAHASLAEEYVRGVPQGNLVCTGAYGCWDEDHPQLWVGSIPVGDKETVPDARPEPTLNYDRSLFGFNPVSGAKMFFRSGTVTAIGG